MGGLFARSADRDIIALGRAQHHQAHDRSAGHGLPILFDQDFAGQATGKRDKLCTGPRMQTALVRDLHLSPVSGHVDVPSSSDATLIYFWPASRAAATAFCRSEEHTSELQSLMRISYAVFCLKKKKTLHEHTIT